MGEGFPWNEPPADTEDPLYFEHLKALYGSLQHSIISIASNLLCAIWPLDLFLRVLLLMYNNILNNIQVKKKKSQLGLPSPVRGHICP